MLGQRFLLVLILAVSIGGFSHGVLAQTGQSSGTPTDQNPTFKVNVKLVLVRVVVRDPQGHVVENLKKDDFQLFDKGKPQVISQFAIEDSGAPTSDAAGVSPSAGRQHYVAYLFDDEHLKFANLN